jgi:hypothetical protein
MNTLLFLTLLLVILPMLVLAAAPRQRAMVPVVVRSRTGARRVINRSYR